MTKTMILIVSISSIIMVASSAAYVFLKYRSAVREKEMRQPPVLAKGKR